MSESMFMYIFMLMQHEHEQEPVPYLIWNLSLNLNMIMNIFKVPGSFYIRYKIFRYLNKLKYRSRVSAGKGI
jgi:hypothetical protein